MTEARDARTDRTPPLTFNAWLRWELIRRVLAQERGSLLEVGCGGGALGVRLAARFDYTGYEPDPLSAERAAARLRGRGRIHAEVLPAVPVRRFDVLCAFEVLEHIEDDHAALVEWSRWLRPGGLLLLSVPAHAHRFGAADRAVGHFRRYDHEALRRLFLEVGLTDPAIRSYGFPFGYALEAGRNFLTRERDRGEVADRTAASGRLFQPAEGLGWATGLVTWPFRIAQRPFEGTRIGTGIVAWARTAL